MQQSLGVTIHLILHSSTRALIIKDYKDNNLKEKAKICRKDYADKVTPLRELRKKF